MSELKAIIGLGNPGDRYSNTRHNIGYLVVDALLQKFRGNWKPGRGNFFYAQVKIGGKSIYLLRSSTYMNDSGIGVTGAVQKLNFFPDELLVILDDFALPFGQIRIRKSGSDGGHNGLASIIYHLNTQDFPRMRIGIGPLPDGMSSVNFVLGEFLEDERKALPQIIDRCSDAVVVAVRQGIDRAMEKFNRRINEKDRELQNNKI
ncbi:aminoacyl-tRNA hydrolase [bacterium]|nr:MAG: aminoacyl-tRNA hydrolase [bacterium]